MSKAKYTVDLSGMYLPAFIYPYVNGDEELDWQEVGTFSMCKKKLIAHLEMVLIKAKELTEKDVSR